MRNKILMTLSIATATLLLSGCGGASNETTANGSSTISGRVADGYLVGAEICLDKNMNSACDAGEPSAMTTAGGEFSISGVSAADASRFPLFVEVDEFVVDEDDNLTVRTPYFMSAPAGATFVSPLSTMVHYRMLQNSQDENSARASVGAELGISNTEMLHLDYMALSTVEAREAHLKAKVIANLKMEVAQELGDAVLTQTSREVVDSYINGKISSEFGRIKIALASQVGTAFELSQGLMAEMSVTGYAQDFITIANSQREEEPSGGNGEGLVALSTHTVEANTNYTYTYSGGTDFKSYTVANSVGKKCTLNILDSSFSFNEYKNYAYMVNGDQVLSSKALVNSSMLTSDTSFNISWWYYTSDTSHIDFNVTCEEYVAPPVDRTVPDYYTASSTQAEHALNLKAKYGFTLLNGVESIGDKQEIFFKSTSLGEPDANTREIKFSNNLVPLRGNDWAGLAVGVNGEVMGRLEFTDSTNIAEVQEVVCRHNRLTLEAQCRILDSSSNEIAVYTISDVALVGGRVIFKYFIAKQTGSYMSYSYWDMRTLSY